MSSIYFVIYIKFRQFPSLTDTAIDFEKALRTITIELICLNSMKMSCHVMLSGSFPNGSFKESLSNPMCMLGHLECIVHRLCVSVCASDLNLRKRKA